MLELNGIGGLKTTIITAYCPVHSPGLGGCYTQHLTYMSMHCSDPETSSHFIPEHIKCSRQLFGYNLCKFIEKQIEPGHQIIVMGDFNSEYVALQEWMLYLGLLDIIENKHGYKPAPKMHSRSTNSLIDCIFASAQVSCAHCGFLALENWTMTREAFGQISQKCCFSAANPTTYAS